MSRLSPNDDYDFNIYVDHSDFSYPMDSDEISGVSPKPVDIQDEEESELHPSIEADEHATAMGEEDKHASALDEEMRHQDEGADSSSQHDEDVFSDKSHRSSIGSYDGGSESGKGSGDNTTTIRSPRISEIGQYDKEDFIPTARGTPRPPFRTPSDVRAMQMSSPTPSVLGSPRAAKKGFPTVSRLGTPSGSAQYSPKRKSTPPRFKSRLEAPLVLLHVTLLPLRWVWGDIVNNLDPTEMSNQAKALRDAWQMLQDRVGDTVIERGILLGHPQNDYEVLEERLLEALELPLRRRARILECGHYLGPANESTISDDDDSEDDYEEDRRHAGNKRHWCKTCKHDIRYESLGANKIFRVKVYASNGLMKAGAWAACWKEMERVDVELEPIVDGAVQDEIVRLAAQQDHHLEQEEDDSFAEDVAQEREQERQDKKRDSFHSDTGTAPRDSGHERSESEERRQRDAERLREIYGHTPPPAEDHPEDSFAHQESQSYNAGPSPRSPSEGAYERRDSRRQTPQSASMPQLLIQSARVLVQDRKNIVIFTLGVLVLMLALRNPPRLLTQEPSMHSINHLAEGHQRTPAMDVPEVAIYQEYQSPIVVEQEGPSVESIMAMAGYEQPYAAMPDKSPQAVDPMTEAPSSLVSEEAIPVAAQEVDEVAPVEVKEQEIAAPAQEEPQPISEEAEPVVSVAPEVEEIIETVTQKRVVKVVHTVTETETQTQTQTSTQTLQVQATQVVEVPLEKSEDEAPEAEPSVDAEEASASLGAEAVAETHEAPEPKPEREPIIVEASFASAAPLDFELDDEPFDEYPSAASSPEAELEVDVASSSPAAAPTISAEAGEEEEEAVVVDVVPEPTPTPLTAAEVEALLEEQDAAKPEEEEEEAELAAAALPTSPFVDLGELPAIEAADQPDAKDTSPSPLRRAAAAARAEEEEEEPFTLAKACEAFLVSRELLQQHGLRAAADPEEPEATTPAEDLVCGGAC
ncbi:hypothetical protein F4809DRAFT_596714 [Biscogniauxia mediterranea]|nr:hypothetical protein F4809DRAFT_596714 [Biscogniauxia mediterranea]